MIRWFNRNFGFRHYYTVKIEYVIKGKVIFHWISRLNMTKKSDILNNRECLKVSAPLHLRNDINKSLLDNGSLNMTVISYMGYFKK